MSYMSLLSFQAESGGEEIVNLNKMDQTGNLPIKRPYKTHVVVVACRHCVLSLSGVHGVKTAHRLVFEARVGSVASWLPIDIGVGVLHRSLNLTIES